MNVLVACECSGIVRDAFIAAGHNAMSCDLQETERPGPHIVGDVLPLLRERWDLVIAHPPCTRLCNSGVAWLEKRNLWNDMRQGAKFFMDCLNANAPRVCVENPIPHGYAMAIIREPYSQVIQPWMFGHGETKATCLWLRGLPTLRPTRIVDGKEQRLHRLPPGPERAKERSRTYPGIAAAMAEQWGQPYVIQRRLFSMSRG